MDDLQRRFLKELATRGAITFDLEGIGEVARRFQTETTVLAKAKNALKSAGFVRDDQVNNDVVRVIITEAGRQAAQVS